VTLVQTEAGRAGARVPERAASDGTGTPRVAIVTNVAPPDYGGAALSAYKTAARLLATGRLAFVVTRTQRMASAELAFKDARGLPTIPEERVVRVAPRSAAEGSARGGPLRLMRRFWSDVVLLPWSTTRELLARRAEYEVAHCFAETWLSFYAVMLSWILGKRSVVEVTLISDPDTAPAGGLWSRLGSRAIRRFQLRTADRVVAISPAVADECVAAGVDPSRLEVVPRPVDVQRFRPLTEEERERVARELGLEGGGPIILFVGSFSYRKGADQLVPIFAGVAERYPSAVLVLVGQAGLSRQHREVHAHLLQEIDARGLRERVKFVERTGRIEHYMAIASVFLFPSRWEGFGTVVVEAMACGVPVVARKIPRVTDYIIRDGVDGFYLADAEPEPFTDAVLRLLDDPVLHRRVSRAAVESAHARFRPETIDASYAALYAAASNRAAG
jgi:L-malate glycosyltransferase